MKKICLIVCYFGKMPNYFNLWLNSCKYNNTIDFLIFTDNHEKFNYPQNVKVIYTTFEKIKEKIQNNFDFKISLEKPYKLCDYKPIYGQIFQEYIEEYDYWGHCDIDTIFGDLRKYLKEDILIENDKIFKYGHFSLYKNEKRINENYKELIDAKTGTEKYKKVFEKPDLYCFDETAGIVKLYDNIKYKMYSDRKVIADISIKYNNLIPLSWKEKKKKWIFNFIIESKQSKLYGYYIENDILLKKEFMYIHLQKRNMKIKNNNENCFLIVPNQFIDINKEINSEILNKYNHRFTIYRKKFLIYRGEIIRKKILKSIKEGFNNE